MSFILIEYKLGQYADDTFLFLDGEEDSLKESLSMFEKFREVSGLKINLEKTQAVWIGKHTKKQLCPEINIQWSDTFKVLGINFSNDLTRIGELNFSQALVSFEKILSIHKHRNLSL